MYIEQVDLYVTEEELSDFIVRSTWYLFKRAHVTYSLSWILLMSLQGCTYIILYELTTRILHTRRHHQAYVGT